MEEKVWLRNSAGESLSAILSVPGEPNGKGVVLLHCFLCTKTHRIVREVSKGLVERGFTVLRFDFSGNGESKGRLEDATYTKMIGEVGAAVSFLEKRGVTAIGVAGHSMGAMLAILSAAGDERIKAVGFLAGSSQAARVREIFPSEALERAQKDGETHTSVYGRDLVLKREFLRDLEKYDVARAVAGLRRPLIVVHGDRDEVIPPYHAMQMYEWACEPKTLEIIKGADHLFTDERHLEMLKAVVGVWFSRAL